MSYQTLARKYRPQRFEQLVGHAGTRCALENALNQKQLHHTYLLTGARGVGKTSLARLFAKCLSCETSISSTPCNECNHCTAIQNNQFIDCLEVDAASRTRVEDTQSLLENVQYKPTVGRYKIYIIDEVHMLSMHSFNALLKTLEEPPSHVMFLLATTDIQRVPETIVSRCLHFPLKMLGVEEMTKQLAHILQQEKISHYEPLALKRIATLAKGSMRDALSLLEPIILHGNMDEVTVKDVQAMFGCLEATEEIALINAIHHREVDSLLNRINALSQASTDFEQLIDHLMEYFYQIALAQQIDTNTISQEQSFEPEIMQFSKQIQPEQVQLYYQIALTSKKDIQLAPTPILGFKMMMLRMVAFNPVETKTQSTHQDEKTHPPATLSTLDWPTLVSQLPLTGFLKELALHSSLEQFEADTLYLLLDAKQKALYSEQRQRLLQEVISQHLKRDIQLYIKTSNTQQMTPAKLLSDKQHSERQLTRQAILQDEGVKSIQERFDANLKLDAIKIRSTKQHDKQHPSGK